MKYCNAILFLAVCLGIVSCGQAGLTQFAAEGAIVLGDSATIVTETDTQYLKDNIPDIELAGPATPAPEIPPVADTPQSSNTEDTLTPPAPVKTAEIGGFTIDIGNATIVLTGIEAKELKKQDPVKDPGVSYLLSKGDISTEQLIVTGAKDVKVLQRYQSRLYLETSLGNLELESLGYYTDDWQSISGNTNGSATAFKLTHLDNPEFVSVNNARIRLATENALKKTRVSSQTKQQWLKAVGNIKSTRDKACDVKVKNIQWKVSGVDSRGQKFNKNVRLDIP